MRALIQRVRYARVTIAERLHAAIGPGLLVLVGAEDGDQAEDVAWLSGKVVRLRIFTDAQGKMNHAVNDIGGEVLVVSQFTLFASTTQGNRPSFFRAAAPAFAEPLYQDFVAALQRQVTRPLATGVFAADMQVELLNDGPITVLIDSRRRE